MERIGHGEYFCPRLGSLINYCPNFFLGPYGTQTLICKRTNPQIPGERCPLTNPILVAVDVGKRDIHIQEAGVLAP